MKCIILAAGKGTRIPQITKKKPKCLITINKISILKRQINFLKRLGINDIIVVNGYKKNQINFKNIKYITNKNFENNEQLESLFTANKELNSDLIITFADTIYDFSVLKQLLLSRKKEIILGVDRNWKKRYKFRYDHPYSQADKVRINKKGEVKIIGKQMKLKDTNAEFLGILRLSKKGCQIFIKNFKILQKKMDTKKLQIHHFIQYLIKNDKKICTCNIEGQFMEIDTFNDYKIAKKIFTN
jgi:L-glutamine-phosphate cytidylyltransferase|tara:strand:+ start:1000 stop:1725 length:726 start_codon:yes stop_codon:yes gene_type:complete